jgi:hypothetical protein
MNAVKSNQQKPLVFISYARDDNKPHGNKKGWLDRLLLFLERPLEQAGIDLFIDNTIISGEYSPAIKAALDRATTALLLVSPSFMASDYIIEHELPVIISRYKAGDLDIFPVLISCCPWDMVHIPYPGQEEDNLPDGFLLSRLLLPGHDPDHPLDDLPESKVNKVFTEVTKRILAYHKKRKNIPGSTTIVSETVQPDNTTIVSGLDIKEKTTIVVPKPA